MPRMLKHKTIDFLYEDDGLEETAFGDKYNPPGRFEHGEETLVATYKGEGDGQTVHVYECRMPARFYTVKVLKGTNTIGEVKKAYTLGTGSGSAMEVLAAKLAEAISQGMLSLKGKV